MEEIDDKERSRLSSSDKQIIRSKTLPRSSVDPKTVVWNHS